MTRQNTTAPTKLHIPQWRDEKSNARCLLAHKKQDAVNEFCEEIAMQRPNHVHVDQTFHMQGTASYPFGLEPKWFGIEPKWFGLRPKMFGTTGFLYWLTLTPKKIR